MASERHGTCSPSSAVVRSTFLDIQNFKKITFIHGISHIATKGIDVREPPSLKDKNKDIQNVFAYNFVTLI